jgi:methyl-galactoside transport system substrate-binding protein
MKRIAVAVFSLLTYTTLAVGFAGTLSSCQGSGGKPRIGVALSSVDDGYIAAARRAVESEAAGKARLSVLDGQNQSSIQGDQVRALIADKANAVLVDPVDSTSIEPFAFLAKSSDIPIVFFGRNLPDSPAHLWDKAYFVGGKAEEAAGLQAEILADYWKDHPEADKNGDGKLEYILIRGDNHHASELAAELSREKAFAQAGIACVKLAEIDAGWTRASANQQLSDRLKTLAALGRGKPEAVLCGNDEMALGAVEALRMAGMLKGSEYTPVLGIDGTSFAIDAIGEGTLLGTVRCDAGQQGRAAFILASTLAARAAPSATGLAIDDYNYVYVPYQKVTKANYQSVQ